MTEHGYCKSELIIELKGQLKEVREKLKHKESFSKEQRVVYSRRRQKLIDQLKKIDYGNSIEGR